MAQEGVWQRQLGKKVMGGRWGGGVVSYLELEVLHEFLLQDAPHRLRRLRDEHHPDPKHRRGRSTGTRNRSPRADPEHGGGHSCRGELDTEAAEDDECRRGCECLLVSIGGGGVSELASYDADERENLTVILRSR